MVDFDIDKICRVCLQSDVEVSLLYDGQNAVNGVCLSDMISECTMYTVRRYDGFPDLICIDCMERVRSAYAFKKQFETSHRKLISFLESTTKFVPHAESIDENTKSTQTEDTTLYPCEKCDEKFINYERLREHRSVAHKGTANVCRLCLKTFNRIADLKNHIAIWHPESGHVTPNECSVCKKKFIRKDHVVRHMRMVHKINADAEEQESNENPYNGDGNDILDETEIEMVQEPNSDIFTAYDPVDEIEINEHFKVEKEAFEESVEIKYSLSQEPKLETLSNYDPADRDEIESPADFVETNTFSSDEDEKPLSKLRSPIVTESKETIELNDAPSEIPNGYSIADTKLDDLSSAEKGKIAPPQGSETSSKSHRYKCSQCDKAFTRSNHVKRHLLWHSQEKPFSCDLCDKRFNRADKLKKHLTNHKSNKPYSCCHCNQAFSRSDLLNQHYKQKHSGNTFKRSEDTSVYPCEKCDEKFITYEHLREHRSVVHKGTPNACRLCLRTFKRLADLKSHIAIWHPESGLVTDYECTICKKMFTRKDHVARHIRKVHKIYSDTDKQETNENSTCNGNDTLDETEYGMVQEPDSDSLTAFDQIEIEHFKIEKETFQESAEIEISLRREPKLETLMKYNPADRETLGVDFAETKTFTFNENKNGLWKPRGSIATEHKDIPNAYSIADTKLEDLSSFETEPGDCNESSSKRRRYKCHLCDRAFTRSNHVKRHLLWHSQEKPFSCDICNKRFSRSDKLKIHLTSHKSAKPYKCCNCDRAFSRSDLLNQHLKQKHGGDTNKNTFSCNEDKKPDTMLRRPIVEEHKKTTVVKDAPSDTPNAYFIDVPKLDDKSSVEREKITPGLCSDSSSNRRFKCTQCDKVFTRSNHVKRHLLSHSQEKPFSCDVCNKRFNRADHLKIHLTNHNSEKPYKCCHCDRAFSRSDLLNRHSKQKHGGDTLIRSEICKYCNRSFSSKYYLQKHMRLHTERKWKCKYCEIQFDTKESLKEHTKSHSTEKPFLCSECGQCFIRKDYLLIHMRRHNGEKPYKCKYCDKGFPRATDLKVHERYHTGEKTHLCTICGKGFHRGYNLVVHMRVHTGERPYKCPHCPKDFSQANDLKVHVRRHTGERFKCKICGTEFMQGYNLTQHKLAVHGIDVESRKGRVAKVKCENLSQEVIANGGNPTTDQMKT